MQPHYGRYAVGYSPSGISKINAIIGRYCIEELVDPYSAIYKMRGSLNNLGLSFDEIGEESFVERNGAMSYPLKALGGRFGKDTDTPHDEFLNDDRLSHIIAGGLSLQISNEKTDTKQRMHRAHIEECMKLSLLIMS